MTTPEPPKISRIATAVWLLVVVWTGLILWAGSDNLSMAQTSRFLVPLLRWLMPDADGPTLWKVLFTLRKAAHLIEYVCKRNPIADPKAGVTRQLGADEAGRREPTQEAGSVSPGGEPVGVFAGQLLDDLHCRRSDRT